MNATQEIAVPEDLDQDAQAVFRALSDPKWDFRTVDGIARETRLAETEITRILENNPKHFRKSLVPDRNRRTLYTLTSRPPSWQERLATLRAFATKSI